MSTSLLCHGFGIRGYRHAKTEYVEGEMVLRVTRKSARSVHSGRVSGGPGREFKIMPIPVKIPKIGMSMTEATVVRWLVATGERVEQKQPLAEIETDKIVSDLESPARGILTHCSVAEGDVAAVAQTIAWILEDGDTVGDIPSVIDPAESEPEHRLSSPPAPASPGQKGQPTSGATSTSSPAVRRLARELCIDLSSLVGSGPDGRIVKQDVLQAAQQQKSVSADESVLVPLSATRRAIAATVTKSAAIPQIMLSASADVSSLITLRQQDRAIAYDDVLVSAVAKTLRNHKYLNASYEDTGIRLHSRANIGLAVAVDEGLLIPVIRGAAELSLSQIGTERKRLVDLVRSRTITTQDTAGGTFTITNLGMFPVDSFAALINPPQVAILSVGRIQHTAVPGDEGGIVFRPRMTFGLTLDHRVADGAAGAAFLKDFIARIEKPDREAT